MYDAAIIGTGPAGLSAALNLKIHQKNFIWLGTKSISDKVSKAEQILNYPGLSKISGEQLVAKFQQQIKDMDLEITEAMVNSIMALPDYYAIVAGSEYYEAKTIILTTGIVNSATLVNEKELVGKGVSYCATCDGMLYKNKEIAVITNAARFEHEVKFLADIAKKVYLFTGYANSQIVGDNIVKIEPPVKILGEQRVTGLQLKSGQTIEVSGVFCLRNSIAMTTLLPGLELENNHIKVNRQMETNMPGCFAAGDCTGSPYQYTKSVGEGNVAAHSLLDYLAKHE